MKIVNVVFEKVGDGRGRPSKFYVMDDGNKIHWKTILQDHPNLIEDFENTTITKIEPVVKKEEVTKTVDTHEVIKTEPINKGKLVEVEGTIPTKTTYGTPVNMVQCIGNPTNGIDLVKVLVYAKTNREYVTSVSSKDLIKPECELPEDFKLLKFAGE